MPRKAAHPRTAGRRTTLTLPAAALARAERLARTRNVNLSTLVGEALTEGLALQAATERSDEVLRAYQRAFAGLSETEIMTLDGIILDPVAKKKS